VDHEILTNIFFKECKIKSQGTCSELPGSPRMFWGESGTFQKLLGMLTYCSLLWQVHGHIASRSAGNVFLFILSCLTSSSSAGAPKVLD